MRIPVPTFLSYAHADAIDAGRLGMLCGSSNRLAIWDSRGRNGWRQGWGPAGD